MTKVYIFAIAKHHSTAPFFLPPLKKKIEKILSQKKKKLNRKQKKI